MCPQLLGQGGLFRRVMQVIRAGGGVEGLRSSRIETAISSVLEQVVPLELFGSAGAQSSDR